MARFNVVGFASGNLGLGVLTRNIVQLLLGLGHEVSVFDVDPGLGRGGRDLSLSAHFVDTPEALSDGVNLFVLAAPELREVITRHKDPLLSRDAFNVALPMWELPVFPRRWGRVFEFFDCLAAATPFIRCALDTQVTSTPTIDAPIPVHFPASPAPDRNRLGLPAGRTLFFTAFEPHSDPLRKNAIGALTAFERSGVGAAGADLVIKVNNPIKDDREHPSLEQLRKRIEGSEGIHLLTDVYQATELAGLYGAMDVFLSLHRAEGLGLVPMEAMSIGKPVVATAWSGNMAFMNRLNACLVGYHLAPVTGRRGVYAMLMRGTRAKWAEPNLDQAATWIRRLAQDNALREQIGRTARRDIERYNATAKRGSFVDEILALSESRTDCRKTPETRFRTIRQLERLEMQPSAIARLRARASRALRLRDGS